MAQLVSPARGEVGKHDAVDAREPEEAETEREDPLPDGLLLWRLHDHGARHEAVLRERDRGEQEGFEHNQDDEMERQPLPRLGLGGA